MSAPPFLITEESVSAMESEIFAQEKATNTEILISSYKAFLPLVIFFLIWFGALSFFFACLFKWLYVEEGFNEGGQDIWADMVECFNEFKEDLVESFQNLEEALQEVLGLEMQQRPLALVQHVEENGGGDQGQMHLALAENDTDSGTTDEESSDTSETESDDSSIQPNPAVVASDDSGVEDGAGPGDLVQDDSGFDSDFELIGMGQDF